MWCYCSGCLYLLLLFAVACPYITAAANLTHRYSFDGTPYDSVGGASWNGAIQDGAFVGKAEAIFNPEGEVNSVVGVLLPPGLVNGLVDVSIEIWYKSFDSIVDKTAAMLLCFDFIRVGSNPFDSHLLVEYIQQVNDATVVHNITAPTAFYQKQREYLAIVFKRNESVKVYVRGTLVAQSSWVFQSISKSLGVANYLGSCGSNNDSFHGMIDELRIWSGSLSEAEVGCHNVLGVNKIDDYCSESGDLEPSPSPTAHLDLLGRHDNERCSPRLPLPLWTIVLITFLCGVCIGAILVILFCKCVYSKYKNGVEYDALGIDDFLGDDGVAMNVVL